MRYLKLPLGMSDFEEIRQNGYYYIDKSGLISDLLVRKAAKVTLITRPRRFGKTLGMSMLAHFFDIEKNSRALFEGLEISKQKELCVQWMNQYPVIFLTFKKVDGLNFKSAYEMLEATIAEFCLYSIRITVNTIRNDGTTRKEPGNGGKPRKIKGFSELMKRGGTRIDTYFEKRANF